ncbi:MAG: hypothetical protein U0520_03330 [Candidatus Saccharimonadales bacterium]
MAEAQPTTQQHVQTTFEGDGFVQQITNKATPRCPITSLKTDWLWQ